MALPESPSGFIESNTTLAASRSLNAMMPEVDEYDDFMQKDKAGWFGKKYAFPNFQIITIVIMFCRRVLSLASVFADHFFMTLL